jgi:hypothetical protein
VYSTLTEELTVTGPVHVIVYVTFCDTASVVVSDPLVGSSVMLSGASLLLLVIVQVSPAGRLLDVQLNVTLLPIMVVVAFAPSVIDPAAQVSTALLLVMLPLVAVIVELPADKHVASPALLMDATKALLELALLEFQVTVGLVRLVMLPNVSVPVAVNCCVPPTGIDGEAGVTVMDVNTAAVQFKVAVPLMLPLVALIVELPI